jgi:hypothetical protein
MEFSREDVVLAGLGALGPHVWFRPVQLQKLFFLLDQEASQPIGGPHFNFRPYNYGPFDRGVYDAIEGLAARKLAAVGTTGRYSTYSATAEGAAEARSVLARMDGETHNYIKNVASWVLSVSFDQLVSSIHNAYPQMKVNSIFQD